MDNKGILTLQFGHYSNFIGTHWWNSQEQGFSYNSTQSEINHDVLYREGLTEKNEVTFTPRLLLVDLKGSLKNLPERGDLYEKSINPSKEEAEWDSNLVEIDHKSSGNKNQFLSDLEDPEESKKVLNKTYNLEQDVTVWSDFLYSRFHPRTVNLLNEYQHGNEHTPFDLFPLGTNVWKSEFEDDFSNKIRNYVEECDYFQGFHLISDCTDAFSGLSSSCMEHLQDDYSGKSIFACPVIPSFFHDSKFTTKEQQCHSIMNESVRVLNLALSFNAFNSHSSLFVPLCTGSKGWRQPGPKREFYRTEYNHELAYHSSAILAAALDTFTLKYRLKSDNFSLVDLCADLSRNGRKAAAASLCLPFSIHEDIDPIHCVDNWDGPLSKSITPNCEIGSARSTQYLTLRGIGELKTLRDASSNTCGSIANVLNMYLTQNTDYTLNNVTVVMKPLDVKTPFPRIFDNSLNRNVYVSRPSRPQEINVERIPVLAGLHSGNAAGTMLESLYKEARRIKYPRFHQFISAGIDTDSYEECLESLLVLTENYSDNYFI